MTSLRGRLTLGIGAVLALVLVVLWFALGSVTRSLAEDFVASRLEHDAEGLLTTVTVRSTGMNVDPASISPAYLRPFSGHYFTIDGGGMVVQSRSLWDAELPLPLASATPLRFRTAGPLDQSLLVFVRRYHRLGEDVTVAVAENLTPLDQRIAGFQRMLLAILGGGLGAVLLLQAWSVRRALTPLEKLRAEVARLQQGQVAALAANVPREVAPLVAEINHLLTLIAHRLERSRNATGDLAHALKGPLSRLVRHAEDPNGGLTPDARSRLLAETAAIRGLVDRELKRARLAGHARPGQHFHPAEEIPHLVKAIQAIYADKPLSIEAQLGPDRRVAVDRDDMLELLGNLLDNAAKWARTRILVTLLDEPGLHLMVEDDGPGVPETELTRLATRGVRLDETSSGSGLGLSIVGAIVNEYGGSLTLERSARLGGFLAEIRLPPAQL